MMSALGHKQTLGRFGLMSALPPRKRTISDATRMSALCHKQTFAAVAPQLPARQRGGGMLKRHQVPRLRPVTDRIGSVIFISAV
jgi:hypothetical protein